MRCRHQPLPDDLLASNCKQTPHWLHLLRYVRQGIFRADWRRRVRQRTQRRAGAPVDLFTCDALGWLRLCHYWRGGANRILSEGRGSGSDRGFFTGDLRRTAAAITIERSSLARWYNNWYRSNLLVLCVGAVREPPLLLKPSEDTVIWQRLPP